MPYHALSREGWTFYSLSNGGATACVHLVPPGWPAPVEMPIEGLRGEYRAWLRGAVRSQLVPRDVVSALLALGPSAPAR